MRNLKGTKRWAKKQALKLARSLGYKPVGPFRRHLSFDDAQLLASSINAILSLSLKPEDVLATMHKIIALEKRMQGRIAGDIDDCILNYYMVLRSMCQTVDQEAVHAEIGVLFGGSLLIKLQALRDMGVNAFIVAIDPLDRYYEDFEDPVTCLPVTRQTVLENISSAGFDIQQVVLFPTLSQNPNTIQAVRDMKLTTLYIDGEHSYQGVRSDWEHYASLVIPGGFVLIDNYHDGYRGIDQFVDQDLRRQSTHWRLAGSLGRSVVFERIND
ncbi:class I SAM-dependent methyltransferase [Candidatus Parcubacteria bacterium]|nr:MAG: class I SAM-dependent methyltransferase [Candidatus Parcubacteria bacterium]